MAALGPRRPRQAMRLLGRLPQRRRLPRRVLTAPSRSSGADERIETRSTGKLQRSL